jgi:hypothetical protein
MNLSTETIKKYKDLPKIIGVLVALMGAWKAFDFYYGKTDTLIREIAKEETEAYYKEKELEFIKLVNDYSNKKIYSPMYSFAENYTLLDSLKLYIPLIAKLHANTRIIINVKVLDKATGKMYFIDGYGNEYPLYQYNNGVLKGENTYIDDKLNVVK